MLLYLFFDCLLSTCSEKTENVKRPKAADFPLRFYRFSQNSILINILVRYIIFVCSFRTVASIFLKVRKIPRTFVKKLKDA